MSESTPIITTESARLGNSPRVRRILQMVSDFAALSGKSIKDIRVLDLACAHGQYALELARRGAYTLGIEGRVAWVNNANLWMHDLGIKCA